MKNFISIALLMISFTKVNASTLDAEVSKLEKFSPQNERETAQKLRMLTGIRKAQADFKEWKRDTPNHKEIKSEMERVIKAMTTKRTPENFAMNSAARRCQETPTQCSSILASTLEAIYANSDIAALTKSKSFSIFPEAHASNVTARECKNGYGAFFAGFLGADPRCGMDFFGLGLHGSAISGYAMLCAGDGRGINAGVYAQASVMLGLNLGLTVGEGGFCHLIGYNMLSLGASAGVVVLNGDKFSNM